MSTDIFQFTSHPKTWDGYRIFAIDDFDIAVAHNKKNETEFGLKKNNHSSYPMARLTALYDVTNDLIVDVQFTDLIRCSHSFLSCVNGCPDGDHTVTDIYKGRTTQIRVIKDTSGEEPHILVSNLFEDRQDASYHQNLYHRRWEIETKYGELKTKMRLENFSGKNPQAIRQDLYAALFISNLSALMKSSAEAEMEEKLTSGKHKYQLNRSYIIGIVSRYVKSLLTVPNYKKQLTALITRIQRMRSIIRPDRHFKRISGHHGTTNGFYIRVNL